MRETNRSLQNLSVNKKLSDREKLNDAVNEAKASLEEKDKETKVRTYIRVVGTVPSRCMHACMQGENVGVHTGISLCQVCLC